MWPTLPTKPLQPNAPGADACSWGTLSCCLLSLVTRSGRRRGPPSRRSIDSTLEMRARRQENPPAPPGSGFHGREAFRCRVGRKQERQVPKACPAAQEDRVQFRRPRPALVYQALLQRAVYRLRHNLIFSEPSTRLDSRSSSIPSPPSTPRPTMLLAESLALT